jgi:hypothetical protein
MLDALLAAASSSSIEGILLNLGLPGVVIFALGWYSLSAIKSGKEREARLEDDKRRLEDDNRRLYQIMVDQMIPPLTRSNDIILRAIDIITDFDRREEKQAALDQARREVEELRRKEGKP